MRSMRFSRSGEETACKMPSLGKFFLEGTFWTMYWRYIGRMFDLKPISPEAVPVALAKAERYRLLNEPWQAESICRDVLRIEPEHDLALTMLLLSLTDQFGEGVTAPQA